MENRVALLQSHNTDSFSSPLAPHNFDYSSSVILNNPLSPENDLVSLFERMQSKLKDMVILQTIGNFNNNQHPAFQTMLNTPFSAERLGVRNLTAIKNARLEDTSIVVSVLAGLLSSKQNVDLENVIRTLRVDGQNPQIKNDLVSAILTTYLIFKQYPRSLASFYAQLHWELFSLAERNTILRIDIKGMPLIYHNSIPVTDVSFVNVPDFLRFIIESTTSHSPDEIIAFSSHSEGSFTTRDTKVYNHIQLAHHGFRTYAAMEKGIELHETAEDFFGQLQRLMVQETPVLHFYDKNVSLQRRRIEFFKESDLYNLFLDYKNNAFLLIVTDINHTEILHSYVGIALEHTVHLLQVREGNVIHIESGLHAIENLLAELRMQRNAILELVTID